MPQSTTAAREYVLGHEDAELKRLIEQGRYWGDLTANLFSAAGLEQGMDVLDIGCGAGDVSFLAARFVGPGGSVLGIDASPQAVEAATRRAEGAGLKNVRFMAGDITSLALEERFDAVVGRLILMYLSDPAVVVRRLAAYLQPGGLVAFQELDLAAPTTEPRCELLHTSIDRLCRAFGRAGVDYRAGLRFPRVFRDAGLPEPALRLDNRVEYGPDAGAYEQIAAITRTLLPVMERTGVATAGEVDIDTLAERLRSEAVALDATLAGPSLIGAWARVGGSRN